MVTACECVEPERDGDREGTASEGTARSPERMKGKTKGRIWDVFETVGFGHPQISGKCPNATAFKGWSIGLCVRRMSSAAILCILTK